ncbi:MAG: sigma factor-like helix-turn-helix DNA-binding protein [Pseudonocardiaceae bacterium]
MGGTKVMPPPIFAAARTTPIAVAVVREPSHRQVDPRHCARLPALIAALPSPDREIVLLRVVAGLSVADVVATLGVTPAAIHLVQQQARSALQPAAVANGPPLSTRQRVVLLPHTHTDTRPTNGHTAGVTGMNQDSPPRHHPTRSAGGTRAVATTMQWHDAELAMKVARHTFEEWLLAGQEDPSSPATMQAYHTHAALHEAARVIAMLIETFRVDVSALISAPTRDTGVLTQRH